MEKQIVDIEAGGGVSVALRETGDHKFVAVVTASIAALSALVYRGVTDCSTNPNYPAASAGDVRIVSVAGKIGGGSGITVEVGDMLVCNTTAIAGTHAAVGSSWNIIQSNINPALYATLVAPTFTGIVTFPGWSVNGSSTLVPDTDNTRDIGNLAVNPRDIHTSRMFIKKGIASTEGYGQFAIKSIAASKTLTNAQTNTLALQIPSGAKLIGVQLRNDTAIEGVDDATGLVPITTYSAIYTTGSTQTINATIAVAKNTKVNKHFDSNAATDILTGLTDITLDAGTGNKFTAAGVISAVAYYYELTSLTDAA